jgi:hypothetical protein
MNSINTYAMDSAFINDIDVQDGSLVVDYKLSVSPKDL